MRVTWAVACSTAVLVIGSSCAIGGPQGPVIRIGVDLPLSGAESHAATPALNGIRYYIQQHPALDGYSIELQVSDDTTGGVPDPAKGADNMRAFVADPTILAVIGPFDSSIARDEIPIANRALLAMVSPVTSSPCLTQDVYLPAGLSPSHTAVSCKDAGLFFASDLRPTGVNNYFRLAPTDQLQGPAAADYLFNTLQVLRAGVISDNETYGQALADSFSTRFTRLGGSVVGRLDLASSADPTAFLKRVKADGAQAIYYGGVTANNGCVIRAEMTSVFGANAVVPFAGGDGIADDPMCVHDAGTAFAGIYATVPAVDPAAVASANQVVSGFKAAFPNRGDYGAYTVIAYDAAAVVYGGIDRAIGAWRGALPPRGTVTVKIGQTSNLAGATGTIGFDANGDTTHRVISIEQSPRHDPSAPWTLAGTVDYTAALPY